MSKYRKALPQLGGDLFLTDGGLETSLIFLDGIDLPHFSSFVLLDNKKGVHKLREYYRSYAEIAKQAGMGFVLESPTWRSSPDWAKKIGYSRGQLAELNQAAIELMDSIRTEFDSEGQPYVISGNIGPRGDGYSPSARMSVDEARDYHSEQINCFADTAADCVTAVTLNYLEEAIGIALAAYDASMPVVIAFTVETDGRLPSGESLEEAIDAVDYATGSYPAYYMVNCAHTSHFESVLSAMKNIDRLRGIRANASRCSHTELDEAEELDDGNPQEFGLDHQRLKQNYDQFNVFGGCCGSDVRHIEQLSRRLGVMNFAI